MDILLVSFWLFLVFMIRHTLRVIIFKANMLTISCNCGFVFLTSIHLLQFLSCKVNLMLIFLIYWYFSRPESTNFLQMRNLFERTSVFFLKIGKTPRRHIDVFLPHSYGFMAWSRVDFSFVKNPDFFVLLFILWTIFILFFFCFAEFSMINLGVVSPFGYLYMLLVLSVKIKVIFEIFT